MENVIAPQGPLCGEVLFAVAICENWFTLGKPYYADCFIPLRGIRNDRKKYLKSK